MIIYLGVNIATSLKTFLLASEVTNWSLPTNQANGKQPANYVYVLMSMIMGLKLKLSLKKNWINVQVIFTTLMYTFNVPPQNI